MADVNPPVDYVLIGKIVDNDNQPISEAIITSALGESTISQENGDFTLIGKYTPGQIFIVNIFATDYGQKIINPFNLKKRLKNNGGLGIIKLKPSKLDLEEAISQELPLSIDQIRSLQLSKMDFEMAKQQAMNNLVKQIKTVLLPQVLTLIAAFGISKAKDALGKKFGDMNATCPANLDELNALIKKKNKLTKTLNNIYKFLKTVKVGVETLNTTITIAEIVVKTLGSAYNLAPIAGFGAPDVSKPVGKVRDRIEEELKKYKLISSATLIVLTILIQILQIILDYLKLLDSLVQGCAIEGQLPQEQLSQDLLEATQEQSQQLSPVVTNVNGFEMSVVPVDSAVIGGLKRRQAIARNPSGIIMLRGEPSFSSNDQILIDELVYYIQSNNLTVDGVGPPVFNEDNNNTTTSTTSTPVSTGTGGSIGSGGGGGGGY
tara:strand:- start:2027 stop:3325 length:1299 start_codon:yes stop_codon:yes gene_type:complete